MVKSAEQIYAELSDSPADARFTNLEAIKIFHNEGHWVGNGFQKMKCMELVADITGIRPGSCSGCQIQAINDLYRWVTRYETEHPPQPARRKK